MMSLIEKLWENYEIEKTVTDTDEKEIFEVRSILMKTFLTTDEAKEAFYQYQSRFSASMSKKQKICFEDGMRWGIKLIAEVLEC